MKSKEVLLRNAIESGDYKTAASAVNGYFAAFQSQPRSPEEVANARDLFAWSLRAAQAGKARIAAELAFVAGSADD